MGWNDRLLEDPYEPTEEERQRYEAWCEYQEYLKMLDADLERRTPAPDPEKMGLSSQTVSPDCYETYAIDIAGHRNSNTPTPKEQTREGRQEEASQEQDHQAAQDQD